MEPELIFYNPETYLETMSGNKISKKNLIKGEFLLSKFFFKPIDENKKQLKKIDIIS